MVLAQWGMREELLTDPDVWLCFGCTDCSIQCPRGARPGDVMAAVRKEAIREFSPFGFIQKWLSHPRYLPILILVPIVIWGAIYLLFKNPTGRDSYFDGIFPPGVLEPVLGAMTVLGSLLLFVGAVRYWRALNASRPRSGRGEGFLASFVGAVGDAISHARFRKCEAGKTRAIGHMLMLFGFLVILLGGTVVGIGFMFHLIRLPLEHPENGPVWLGFKILLNVGAVGLVAGTAILLWYRLSRPERQMRGTWFDWFFIAALLATGSTGLLTEVMRWIAPQSVAFGVYFVHLVCVFCLLGYAPWSKFAHLVYRTVALAHARYTGREVLHR
jgi:quinone-modifying oxidoreductase subunit QmoC